VKHSITLRLVLTFGATALATFGLISSVLYGVLEREMTRHQYDELRTRLLNLEYSVQRAGTLERWGRVLTKLETMTPADGSMRLWILSDDPRFQYGKDLAEIERIDSDGDGLGSVRVPQRAEPLRMLTKTMPALQDRPAVRLIIGLDAEPYERTLHTFRNALAALSLSAVLLIVLMGWWIARVGLRPLHRLSQEAQALSPKTLSQRLQVAQLPAELSDLTTAFNGALGRLEAAYQQLEAFNADVAHELRTPLANLIGGTQVALSRPRGAAEFQDALQSNLEELERLRSIINDMLFLARADQGEAATGRVEVVVAQEIEKTIEFFEFILDEHGSTVGIDGETQARASIDIALFRRALSNLLQNAIEHSVPGARLAVSIARQAGAVWISVANPGTTIAAAHLPRLFDRFYRVDAARHDDGALHGHGLGLAIVKAVATMHGGMVSARSEHGVTAIGFSVPAATPAGDAAR